MHPVTTHMDPVVAGPRKRLFGSLSQVLMGILVTGIALTVAAPNASAQTAPPAEPDPAFVPAVVPAAKPVATAAATQEPVLVVADPTAIPKPAAEPAAAGPPPPPPVPGAPVWSIGSIDISGLVDGYYTFNANRPTIQDGGNQLYNFNTNADSFGLSAAKLTLNHDADPIGVHVDFLFGETKKLVLGSNGKNDFIEQAYISFKPVKAKGLELDFGQFVTSAGAEVIESKDNWNYSRSLLFAYAIPYYHFGLRASFPATKTWTAGVQVVNGWNNITANNGGVTVGVTSAYVKPKYSWFVNFYTGPGNVATQDGYLNLIDTTITLAPTAKFSAYINYDYTQHRDALKVSADTALQHVQGIAIAAREQITAKMAFAGRYEHFNDPQGFSTGAVQELNEFTLTYEYKWIEGLLARLEYRRDSSDMDFFHKGDTGLVDAQSTLTAGFVAFFGPKR